MVMSSYFRGVANEALVFTTWLWGLIVPTHRTSGDMGMEQSEWKHGMEYNGTNVESSHCVKQCVWNE